VPSKSSFQITSLTSFFSWKQSFWIISITFLTLLMTPTLPIFNPWTVRAFKKLISNHQPDLIFLMETKLLDNQYHFLNSFNDTYSAHIVNCSVSGGGKAGGLATIWNHCRINMDIKNSDLNYIDMFISSPLYPLVWRATGIYGYPQSHNKFLTCELINDLSCTNICSNWLLFGDFNLVLTNEEKIGGNTLEPNITTSFRNTLSHCDLQDLGYNDSIYTWTNKHKGNQLIKSRLDRFLATSDWISTFPNHANTHLVRYKSDHCPILLDFCFFNYNMSNSPTIYTKKFDQIWTTDEHHMHIVKETWDKNQGSIDSRLQHTLNALHSWGSKTFGIIPRRIKTTQQDLHNLQQQQENHDIARQIKEKEKELDDLLEKEEMWWSQRAKTLWLIHGDKNTNFFHQKASQCRRKNKIEAIKDAMNVTQTEKENIEEIFLNHFKLLFTTQKPNNILETTQVVQNRLNQDNHDFLKKEFTADEVYH
jgi:exonuclease III